MKLNLFKKKTLPISESVYQILEKRFQILLTIVLFVPTVFDALNKGTDKINVSILNWGMVIGLLIISYIALELAKKKIKPLTERILTWLIFINIGALAMTFLNLAQYKDSIISGLPLLWTALLAVSINLLPFIIFVVTFAQIGNIFFDYLFNKFSKGGK